MKKTLRFATLVLMAMFVGNSYAQEVTLDFSSNDDWQFPTAKAVDAASFTNGEGYTITLEGTSGNGYRWYTEGYLLNGKQGATLTLPVFDFEVEKIVVYGRTLASTGVKQNIFVGETAVSTETTGATTDNTYVIDYTNIDAAVAPQFVIKVTSNHNTQFTKIEIYKKGGVSKPEAGIEWSAEAASVTIGDAENVFPTLANPNSLAVTYTSSKPEVATINETTGAIELVAAGETTISAEFIETEEYKGAKVSYVLNVLEAGDAYTGGNYSYTFEGKQFSDQGTLTLNGVKWTLTTDAGYFGYDGTKGQQIGSGSKPATTITLATDDITEKITSVSVETSGANSIDATLKVSVASETFGEAYTLTNTSTEQEFAGPEAGVEGELKLLWENQSAKAIYVKAINVKVYDPTTGITTTKVINTADAAVYNMAGQRVTNVQKGIYIQNGKKFVVK